MTLIAVEMIRSNTSKGGWELLYNDLSTELSRAGITIENTKDPIKEFLKVKDEGIFKKIEEERKLEEERAA